MTDRLIAIPYRPDMASTVTGFDFGDEPYQRELLRWLVADFDAEMTSRASAWLYGSEATGVIVGFGSLGNGNWRYPDSKKSAYERVAVIPAVGLRREFWGKPVSAPAPERYSSQIMGHLLTAAGALDPRPPAIGLFVHPDNGRAVRLYERFGFARFKTYTDRETNVTYLGFVRAL